MRSRLVTAAASIFALLLGAAPVLACFDVDTPPTATIRLTSPTSAEVIVTGLVVKAAGVTTSDYCAVALGHSGTLFTSVSGITVVDAGDDPPTPVAEFAFGADANTTSDITTLMPASTWQGFSSGVSGPLSGGTVADLAFTVTFNAGTTYDDIEAELAGPEGLIATDDATAGGNLAGTNQEIEGITGFTELTDCYNDVLDSGEVCDAASNLGCTSGDICAQCSACVTPNPANKCKSVTLKTIGYADKARLKCYAKGAKIGMPPDSNCLAQYANMIVFYWAKLGASDPVSCPLFPSYASDTTVDGLINTFESDVAGLLPYGTTTGEFKCSASKFKAASLRSVNTLKCWIKAYLHNATVDSTCLTKVDLKFNQAFTRAENPGLCNAGNSMNAGTVATRVDQFVSDVLAAIPPP